jgi:hypothetical protein
MSDKTLNHIKTISAMTGAIVVVFGTVQFGVIMPDRVSAQGAAVRVLQTQQVADKLAIEARQQADHDLIMLQKGQGEVMNARLQTILGKLDNLEKIHMKEPRP